MGKKKKKTLTPAIIDNSVEEDIEKLSMLVSSSELKMEVGTIKIVLSKDIYTKLMFYVMATDEEISGLGSCKWTNSEIRITELFLLKQDSSSASTELDDGEISVLINKMIRDGRNPAELRFWFHFRENLKVA